MYMILSGKGNEYTPLHCTVFRIISIMIGVYGKGYLLFPCGCTCDNSIDYIPCALVVKQDVYSISFRR